MRIGIIGAGQVGSRLKDLFSSAGHDVVTAGRAGARDAAVHGELAVLAIPYDACAEALPPLAEALAGKIVVDVTNPVAADWSPMLLGQENSAAEEIARILPRSRVVKAFNTVFADVMTPSKLERDGQRITCFVAGDDEDIRRVVAGIASDAGFAALDVGPLRSARHLEAMAHLNIAVALAGGGTDAAFLYHQRRS
ncbi:MAG: NADPH-dependent F420 reductase [Allosphingosinicella sp.]|uniref:NADPH-dependent F420 reductase n=1 Tax=Allosphingosinicella sp. TaxID=2823234 RepID=UPI003933AD0E